MTKTNRILAFVAGVALLGAAMINGQRSAGSNPEFPAGSVIVGGPFVVGVTARTATVSWIVQNDEVLLKPATPGDTAALRSPALRVERTTYTGLQPNTRYEYNIPSAGSVGKGSFKTAATGSAPFRFVVFGDTRTRHDVHRSVMHEVMNHPLPDFVVHTGDLVAEGDTSAQWPIFFEIESSLLRQAAFFPALGNHERNTHYFREFFKDGAEYYSFDWGNAHFSVLDSDLANIASTPRGRDIAWNEQRQWLEDDLQAHQKADYRFVVAHHPPFTAVTSRQGDNPHMTALTSLFEKYHVAAAFFGHDHNYQHYLKNGIHYVTTGGGGAPLYDVNIPPAEIMRKVVSIENFVEVDVKDKVAHFEAIAIDGKTLEEFEISAQP